MRDVAVHKQHAAVVFHRDAHRQIDRCESLAFARQRARYHHEVTVFDAFVTLADRVADDRPLDDAKLVRHLRLREIGRHEAKHAELLEIEMRFANRRPGGRSICRDCAVGMDRARTEQTGFGALRFHRSDDRFGKRRVAAGPGRLRRRKRFVGQLDAGATKLLQSSCGIFDQAHSHCSFRAGYAARDIMTAMAKMATHDATSPPRPPANR